jgi:thiamine-phosphate pyrophosphorylase
MLKRHTLPRLWLFTDERLGEGLMPAVNRLPKGSGIIFRHYSLEALERRILFERVRRVAKRNRHCLILAGDAKLARQWRADGNHTRFGIGTTAPVHSIRERLAAERRCAALLFLSPVFATDSHPGKRSLGMSRFGILARGSKKPIIALGGMTRSRAQSLKPFGIYGWAAISALSN